MPQRLTSQRRKRRRATFWVIDCETDPFHHCADPSCLKCGGLGRVPQPFIWGAYEGDSDEYIEFTDVKSLAEFFSKRRCTVYAHNGGRFDYHYLRDCINSDDSILIINGRLAKFRIGDSEFRDSLNIFPNTRLKDFDDASGKKLDIDYALMERERRSDPNVKAEISRYLKQDCVRLWNVVRRYWDEYGKSITQASSSLKYWEKHYDQKAPRQTKSQFDRYRHFYYGGRVQCFESGVNRCSFGLADINSAYPFAMLRSHPYSPRAFVQSFLPADDEERQTSLIELDCSARGCFPWRDPDTGKLYFPEDDGKIRRYRVTGHEFDTALELGAVTNVHVRDVHVFPQRVNFKDYIEHFYGVRREAAERGDIAGKIFGKYFMNSLYGKFGSNCENYSEYVIASTDSRSEWESKGYSIYDLWGDRFLMSRNPSQEDLDDVTQTRWRYYNVATAASITGFVRAYLFRAIESCSGVIYCDTDSVAARETSSLDFGDRLGSFKNEGNFDYFAIAGKKLYAFHKESREFSYDPSNEDPSWKIASKGVNFANRVDGPQRIIEIAQGGKSLYRPEVPTYSVRRSAPVFINREVVGTFDDVRQAPLKELPPISLS